MLTLKEAEPSTYHSEATGAEFKFKQSTREQKYKFNEYMDFEKEINNQEDLWVDYLFNQAAYYAAWLLADFSGVECNGKAHERKKLSLPRRAVVIKELKKADAKFSEWFEAHCEPPEKKITEVAAGGEVVDGGSVSAVHGQ